MVEEVEVLKVPFCIPSVVALDNTLAPLGWYFAPPDSRECHLLNQWPLHGLASTTFRLLRLVPWAPSGWNLVEAVGLLRAAPTAEVADPVGDPQRQRTQQLESQLELSLPSARTVAFSLQSDCSSILSIQSIQEAPKTLQKEAPTKSERISPNFWKLATCSMCSTCSTCTTCKYISQLAEMEPTLNQGSAGSGLLASPGWQTSKGASIGLAWRKVASAKSPARPGFLDLLNSIVPATVSEILQPNQLPCSVLVRYCCVPCGIHE